MSKSENKCALVSCKTHLKQEIEIINMFPLIEYHSHVTRYVDNLLGVNETHKKNASTMHWLLSGETETLPRAIPLFPSPFYSQETPFYWQFFLFTTFPLKTGSCPSSSDKQSERNSSPLPLFSFILISLTNFLLIS